MACTGFDGSLVEISRKASLVTTALALKFNVSPNDCPGDSDAGAADLFKRLKRAVSFVGLAGSVVRENDPLPSVSAEFPVSVRVIDCVVLVLPLTALKTISVLLTDSVADSNWRFSSGSMCECW